MDGEKNWQNKGNEQKNIKTKNIQIKKKGVETVKLCIQMELK
jgi:hypothetical protein